MAIGIHWEWRGFGAVSSGFAHRFGKLASLFDPQDVEDVYLWTPGLKPNVKGRNLPEEPFKIKRLLDADGDLEQWAEDDEEIFEFPLNEAGWDALVEEFAKVDVTLGSYRSEEADREMILAQVNKAGVNLVCVNKLRESRLWQGPNGKVKVEWACISSPQAIISIGLETWGEDPEGQGLPDEQAKEDIWAAIKELGLGNEPLRVMNYVDAVAVWASGGKI